MRTASLSHAMIVPRRDNGVDGHAAPWNHLVSCSAGVLRVGDAPSRRAAPSQGPVGGDTHARTILRHLRSLAHAQTPLMLRAAGRGTCAAAAAAVCPVHHR